jgi:CRISPR-associated endonuclease/helicase Cas3
VYEPPEWANLRAVAAKTLRGYFFEQLPCPRPELTNISTVIMALTGFTILCDWLGSNGLYFPARSEVDLDEYAQESARLAQQAVEKAGFFQPSQSAVAAGFATLFPDKKPSRPLQDAIDAIPSELLSGPCLAVIEAPTGEGKTEAALALAHRLAQASGTDELYCALPTTATSNQMFGRLAEYIRDRLGLPARVKLVHGQAFLVEDALQLDPLDNGGQDDSKQASLEWFTSKKLALLAPFGVGTIDQVELAALNVKHNALRMIGLAGKVVIVDEVHAYDVYMTTIVERLLNWLAALGTSVILLSATLPDARRAALARAYGGHVDQGIPDQEAYPSLWVVGRTGGYQATPPAYQPNHPLEIGNLHLADDDAKAKADWLLKAVTGGGCACWITNTVDRAQRMFEALTQMERPDVDCMLLHARFPLDDRQKLERKLADKYGPQQQGDRPQRGIVIGTQVLEQSLDLDFDVMVSDLAPIDLLLQRAGRLHRHQRGDRGAPRLWINTALEANGDPKLGVDKIIYDEYILRQTWLALAGKSEITLPADYRPLIEAVYDESGPVPDSPLTGVWQRLKDREVNAEGEAEQRLLLEPDPEWPFLFHTDTVVRLDTAAPREVQLQLLRHSLRVSQWYVVQALKAEKDDRPRLFTKSALLKGCFPLWLADGQLRISLPKGILVVTLVPDLGLVIRKEGE